MTRQEFAPLIATLFATYGTEVTELALDGYWSALGHLDRADLANACTRAVAGSKFLPRPVELLRLCGELPAEERAEIAWCAVEGAARKAGAWTSVDFDDGLSNDVIRKMGGWPNLCFANSDELPWTRKRFVALYATICASREADPSPVLGLHAKSSDANRVMLISTGLRPLNLLSSPSTNECRKMLEAIEERK